MIIKNKKNTLISLTAVVLIIGALLFAYYKLPLSDEDYSASKEYPDMTATEKHHICIQYNNGLRNGSCTEDAPSYCTTVYYPPSCKECQDARGCGYKQNEKP